MQKKFGKIGFIVTGALSVGVIGYVLFLVFTIYQLTIINPGSSERLQNSLYICFALLVFIVGRRVYSLVICKIYSYCFATVTDDEVTFTALGTRLKQLTIPIKDITRIDFTARGLKSEMILVSGFEVTPVPLHMHVMDLRNLYDTLVEKDVPITLSGRSAKFYNMSRTNFNIRMGISFLILATIIIYYTFRLYRILHLREDWHL